ncbi:efflux transporter outer membrane subunit [Ralstonia insidiosa]|uniref:Efflux transporter outer membrane subunit n=1 Tax=Ralstonia insidiosa TaxID=190721 RepID=A0A848P3E2_9RALS|nr:efflux transporter outer membrane subunit [Ralstonia insidiosa]NMV41812.1 efflux transporter outer membrane subunit [Ralstonia insidiosa]
MQKTMTFSLASLATRAPALLPALLLAAGVLSGCSLAPTYERPDAPVTSTYPQAPAGYAVPADSAKPGENAPRATDLGWREFFPDPRLQKLIGLSLENNRDLRIAVLNIEAARAQYRLQVAELLPPVNASATYTRSLTPQSISQTGQDIITKQYQLGVGISNYQVNLFSVGDVTRSARASYLATAEGQRAAQISLISQVAKAYLNERAYAEQLELAQQTLKGREDYYKLAKQRFDVGASSALDLRQTETLVESARVSVAQLTRQYAQATNALVLLVGAPLPADLPPPTTVSSEKIVADIPPGLPSELLEQRPDIRQAEQKLIAANANIGIARAAFFPSIGLTSNVGTASGALHDLFKAGTGLWSFVPNLTLPIFDWGTRVFQLDSTKANQKIAVATYEKTIQTAFREVSDALVARGTLEEQVAAQKRFRDATAERLTLSDQRYRNGVSSFLDVLDAQRDLFSADQTLVQTRLARLTNAIDLYTALGGGLQESSTIAAAKQAQPTAAPGLAPAAPDMTPAR